LRLTHGSCLRTRVSLLLPFRRATSTLPTCAGLIRTGFATVAAIATTISVVARCGSAAFRTPAALTRCGVCAVASIATARIALGTAGLTCAAASAATSVARAGLAARRTLPLSAFGRDR
jgi:hypothetical protein